MKLTNFYRLALCLLLLAGISAPLRAQTDSIAPVVTLNGDSIEYIQVFNKYIDPGVTIQDNKDNITEWDTAGTFYLAFRTGLADHLGSYIIVYEAEDKSGNKGSATRQVEVIDTIPPRIWLKGERVICLKEGETLEDNYGYEMEENYNMTQDVTVTLNYCDSVMVDTDEPGIYKFRYQAMDKSGNVGNSEWRYVIVKQQDDTSTSCVLTDSLTDKCHKRTAGLADGPGFFKEVRIYPNPANAQLTVKFSAESREAVSIRLMNLNGQCLLAKTYTAGALAREIQLDTAPYPPGVYFIELTAPAGRAYERVVLVH